MRKDTFVKVVFFISLFVVLLVYAAVPSFWDEHRELGLGILAVLAVTLVCKSIFFPHRKDEQEKFGVAHTHRRLEDIQRERMAKKKKK